MLRAILPSILGGSSRPPAPLAAYHFAAGAVTTDATGNGNTLTETGTVATATGLHGDAAQFTDTASRLSKASILTGNCTIAAWVKMTVTTQDSEIWVPFRLADTATGLQLMEWRLEEFAVPASTVTHVAAAINDGTADETTNSAIHTAWHFLALRWDGTTLTPTFDDSNLASVTGLDPVTTLDLSINAATGDLSGAAVALIDDLVVWSTLLSDAQLEWLYNSGSGRLYGTDY